MYIIRSLSLGGYIKKDGDIMRRKKRKKIIDKQLLDTIFTMKQEWQQIQLIVQESIEPTEKMLYKQSLAQAKYLFLLREARYRKISAIRFN